MKGSGAATYFILTSTDGSRTWYGNYGGTSVYDLNAYYIVRFEDIDGNFINYHYTKPFNKSLCISEIRFSGNIATNPIILNKIMFNYVEATRKETAYLKGQKIEMKKVSFKRKQFLI